MQAQKIAILTEVMGFTEAEDKAFWPIYRDYNTEMAKLGDERVALIAEYTRATTQITDDVARSLATRAMDLDKRRNAALERCYTRVGTALSPTDGAQVPAGRASAAADHRSADFGLAADRQVKRGRTVMNTRRPLSMAMLLVLATGVSLSADRVKLRSGKVIEGMFMGADSKSVRVLLDDGQVSEVPIADAVAVEFSARKPAPPPPRQACPKPAAAATPEPRLPLPRRRWLRCRPARAINVRLTQAIDVDSSQAGMTFKGVVDDPVMIGGSIAIPRGASAVLQAVKVEQSGKMKGSDKITLKLNAVSFGGMVHQVATTYVETKGKGEGKKTGRKVGGGAGLGAIVGGIAGGGEGAAIGAAVGGVTGAAVSAGGEEHLKLPAETRLQFQLSAAVEHPIVNPPTSRRPPGIAEAATRSS